MRCTVKLTETRQSCSRRVQWSWMWGIYYEFPPKRDIIIDLSACWSVGWKLLHGMLTVCQDFPVRRDVSFLQHGSHWRPVSVAVFQFFTQERVVYCSQYSWRGPRFTCKSCLRLYMGVIKRSSSSSRTCSLFIKRTCTCTPIHCTCNSRMSTGARDAHVNTTERR